MNPYLVVVFEAKNQKIISDIKNKQDLMKFILIQSISFTCESMPSRASVRQAVLLLIFATTVANAIAESAGFSVAGGGDTLAAIDKYGIKDKVSYISTGGGAFLEFVEGKKLPAVEMLESRAKA